MGFWSKVGKGLGAAGLGAAGLFTGGSTWGALPGILAGAGTALSGLSEGEANNRGVRADMMLDRDRLGLDAWSSMEQALMNRAQESRTSGNNAWGNLGRTSMITNASELYPQFSTYSKVPQFSPEMTEGAQAYQQEALLRLLQGDQVPEMADQNLGSLRPGGLPLDAGGLEKWTGRGAGMAGILGALLNRPNPGGRGGGGIDGTGATR